MVVSQPWSSREWSLRGEGLRQTGKGADPGLRSAVPSSPHHPHQSQCGQPGGLCTMRRPSDPLSQRVGSSHQPFLTPCRTPRTLRLLLLVGLLALPCVSASVGVNGEGGGGARTVCGTVFTDVESSALLAEVVLEGRVREKVFPKNSPAPAPGYYNVSIQVRRQVWKGKELVNRGKRARKLLLGTFRDGSGQPGDVDNSISNKADVVVEAVAGEEASVPLCVGEVQDGASYIFFLRTTGDRKGKYLELSALPVKKSKQKSRLVKKILGKNAASKPVIRRLKGPREVTAGSSVKLQCNAKAKPNPIYSWFRNGEEIKSGRGIRIKHKKRGTSLRISKAKLSSAGVYTCRAVNSLGEASKDTKIRVTKSIHQPCQTNTLCFNGGTCRFLTDLQQPFCQCPKRWAGRRCELLDPLSVGLDPESINSKATLEYERVLIVVGIVIAFLVFLVICIASYFLAKRRRQRWKDRRQMKQQNGGQERERLLEDQPDGNIPQPRALVSKETQTDDIQAPDLPAKRQAAAGPTASLLPSATPTPAHEQPFHMVDHFPVHTSTSAPLTSSHPPSANGRRSSRAGSGRNSRELERRESRSRLKAVSVDDNCRDRPPSWRAEGADAASGRELQSPVSGNQDVASPEAMEMSDLSSPSTVVASPRVPSDEDRVDGLPGFLSSFSSAGQGDPPITMGTPPRDNACAQLKTPEEQACPAPSAMADYDVPKSSAAHMAAAYFPKDAEKLSPQGVTPEELPVNGELSDSESEEEGTRPLTDLHISEEDLNGNLSKADSSDLRSLHWVQAPGYSSEEASSPSGSFPSPPPYTAHRQMAVRDGVRMDGYSPGACQDDDDCGGILPHAPSTKSSPQEMYAYDPAMDSDPDDQKQFMHDSPKKTTGYTSEEIQRDLDRRLQKVRQDQEPIPI